MTISWYFMIVQRIKNFCWAEKLGKIHLGWLWQPSAQENSRETKPPLALPRSETAVGSRLAAQPRQLQAGTGDSSRMQAGRPTLPECALLFSAFSVHLFMQKQKNGFSLLSARCLPACTPWTTRKPPVIQGTANHSCLKSCGPEGQTQI